MTGNNNLNVEKNKAEVSKNVPELRFQGFIDDWEQRKLREVSTYANGGSYENDVLPYGKYELITLKSVNMSGNLVSSGKFLDGNFPTLKKRTLVMILSEQSPGLLGMTAQIPKDNKFVLNQRVAEIRPNYGIDSYFLSKSINNSQKYFSKRGAGTKVQNISKPNVENFELYCPEFEEQQQLGDFFKQLDNALTLHQRKLDKLKRLKQGYLQQLFPKNDEKVPRVRFANFEYEWELRKLGDYSKYRRGSFPQPYGNKEWYDGEGAMPFVQVVDVTSKLTLVENTKQKISKLAQPKSVFVPEGKVIVTLQGSIGRVAITQYESFVDRTLLIFDDYEKATDQRFWAYTIQKKFEIEKLKAPGGTIKTITKEALSSFNVHLPQFEEQQKIGSFFNQLDNTIALHQSKLDKLKSIKQSLLQKMFI